MHGEAQVIVDGGSRERIVGVAAGGHEVVGGDGVGGVGIKGLAAHSLDGDALDALGAVVGGAGILLALVIGLGGVHGELDAAHLGEAADRGGRAVGGSLQSLQQLGAGDFHDGEGVAEGQHSVDILLGDVAGGDGGADAAAVGDSRVHLSALTLGAPDQSVADQVAQV
ncbi:Acetyltransferase (GNAT) family, partial [Dysosmobacter welbionis]